MTYKGYQGYASPDAVDRRRQIAAMLLRGAVGRPPRNLGEGLSAIGAALGYRGQMKRADKMEKKAREASGGRSREAIALALGGGQPSPEAAPQQWSPEMVEETINDPAKMAFTSLVEKGYPAHVAAGLVGNLQQESNFNPEAVGDGGNSYGIAQWNGPRREAYLAWAKTQGRDPGDISAQVDYLDHELTTTESGPREAIMAAPDAATAARVASEKFWRPGVPMMENRVQYANEAMDQYGANKLAQAPASAPQAGPDWTAVQALIGVLNDPWAPAGDKAVAQAFVQQYFERMKPPPDLTPYQKAQLAEREKDRRTRLEAATLGRPQTNVTVDNPSMGSIPQGYEAFKTPEGAWQMRPIPGGPADTTQEDAEKTKQVKRQANIVLEDIDKIIEMAPEWSVGFTGSVLSAVPGTPAHDLARTLDTIKANIGFDKLQAMRDASPTGGALGQVSEFENRLLQATMGNLEQSQSADQFMQNLQRLRAIYDAIINVGIPDPSLDAPKAGGELQPGEETTIDGMKIKRLD